MLLVLTNSGDETSNYLCSRLAGSGVSLARIDTDSCVSTVTVGFTSSGPFLRFGSEQQLAPGDVKHVLLRRPKVVNLPEYGNPAEQGHIANEWAEAIDGFLAHIPQESWMNHPAKNVAASHKLEQLTRAARFGLAVPPSLLTQSSDELAAFWSNHNGRIVVKPLASGHLERPNGGHSSIYTSRVQPEHLNSAPLLRACPTLFQVEVQKVFDVRVTAVDSMLTAVALHRPESDPPDVRRNNMQGVTYSQIAIPVDVDESLRQLLESYGLRFAAVDFGVTDSGDWVFFEINPNGQWAWLDLVGGTSIWEHFRDAFLS